MGHFPQITKMQQCRNLISAKALGELLAEGRSRYQQSSGTSHQLLRYQKMVPNDRQSTHYIVPKWSALNNIKMKRRRY